MNRDAAKEVLKSFGIDPSKPPERLKVALRSKPQARRLIEEALEIVQSSAVVQPTDKEV